MTKYFIQFQHKCRDCQRSVDVVSTNQSEGLMFSRHFTVEQIKFCVNSFGEYLK